MGDDVAALHDKTDKILAALKELANNRASDLQRMIKTETALESLSTQVAQLIPLMPPIRLPAPSLTGEERKAQTESIRAATNVIAESTDVIKSTVNISAAHAQATRWAPWAVFAAILAATFLQTFIQTMQRAPAPPVVPAPALVR